LHRAVRKAGGDVAAEQSVKPWELPRWVIARARELGLQLDNDAARALVAQVGDRQQRLLRELEKLALGAGHGGRIDVEQIEAQAATSAEQRAWSLADALLTGDAAAASRTFLALRAQGERLPGVVYWMAQRVRTALEAAQALEAGEPESQVKRRLRMPSRAADRLLADARRAGTERLRQAVEQIADLELASRGGGSGAASEDTAALLAIQRIAR
jgi:DNA polymerase-3 subunit delta